MQGALDASADVSASMAAPVCAAGSVGTGEV